MHKTLFTSQSLEQTLAIARSIGALCRGGEIFELVSDLGGGKTAFTRGLVSGIGSSDDVTSPSFTINNTYKSGRHIVEHFDFYRLTDGGMVGEELKEAVQDGRCIVAVEWGDIVRSSLGDRTITVEITLQSDDSRVLAFSYHADYSYLFARQEMS